MRLDISTQGLTLSVLNEENRLTEEESKLLPFVQYCKQYLDSRYNRESNFEDIFQLIVDLMSTMDSSVPDLDYDISDFKMEFDDELCRIALTHIIYTVYSRLSILANHPYLSWAKDFVQEISKEYSFLDIFTLNYDTLLDDLVDSPSDGFTTECSETTENGKKYYAFDINTATIPKNRNMLNHLHGSILFLATHINNEKEHSPLYKYPDSRPSWIYSSKIELQNKRLSLYSSIISGQDKLNSLMHSPYSVYHSNLVQSLCNNDCLVIIGYGFGDYYINAQIAAFLNSNGKRVIYISPTPPPKWLDVSNTGGQFNRSGKYDFWWVNAKFKYAATSLTKSIEKLVSSGNLVD